MLRIFRSASLAAALAVGLAPPVWAQGNDFQGEVVGKVRSVSPERHQLTLRDADNRTWTFTLNDSSHVTNGRLNDLKQGERVDVVFRMKDYVPVTVQKMP